MHRSPPLIRYGCDVFSVTPYLCRHFCVAIFPPLFLRPVLFLPGSLPRSSIFSGHYFPRPTVFSTTPRLHIIPPAFSLPPHLPKVCKFPTFSTHLRKVSRSRTVPRAACSRVFPSTVPFPPSEGVQVSHISYSPSEGEQKPHRPESRLWPCFPFHCAFPTFRRCASFPHFLLTFRRWAEAAPSREPPVAAFSHPLCLSHLPKVCKFPTFSTHLPKVSEITTAPRTACSRVFPSTVPFPPSEGVHVSHIFYSLSEGVQKKSSKFAATNH